MGQFPVFDIRDGTLIRYYGCSEHVAIPEGVTRIGEGAFNNYRGRKYVQHVTIPEGVTSIGEGVFYKCSELKEVVFPKSLTEIGAQAFYDCRGLKNYRRILVTSVMQLAGSCFNDVYTKRITTDHN